MTTTMIAPSVAPPPVKPVARPAPASHAAAVPYALRRFSVAEYHRLIEQGFFARDERFELLDGFIVNKMPEDPVHEAVCHRSSRVLTPTLPSGWHVRPQSPITLSESEPEPDLSVARGDELDYGQRHPKPADLALVVEVSNTTLSEDRGYKGPLYAAGMVVAYWILNVVDWRVEVYADPSGPDSAPAYRRRTDYLPGQRVPLPWPGVNADVAVDDLMPSQLRAPRNPAP